MSKIKSVECGCGIDFYISEMAQRHPETTIVMCKKCGHRWLTGTPKDKLQRARKFSSYNRDDEDTFKD